MSIVQLLTLSYAYSIADFQSSPVAVHSCVLPHVDDAQIIPEVHYSSKLRTEMGPITQCASTPFRCDHIFDTGRENFEKKRYL